MGRTKGQEFLSSSPPTKVLRHSGMSFFSGRLGTTLGKGDLGAKPMDLAFRKNQVSKDKEFLKFLYFPTWNPGKISIQK